MSPTKKAVCFFAFVGNGVVAEKGVQHYECSSLSGIWRIILILKDSDSFWPLK